MKTALCLSGQMRTYRQCYPSLKKYLLDPLQPDVFVHTWEKTGLSHKEQFDLDPKQIRAAELTVSQKQLSELFNLKQAVIEPFKERYFHQLKGVAVPEVLKKTEPRHYRGSLPMFYKMQACNDLKAGYEQRHGFSYDMVIKLRPDLLLTQPLPEWVLTEIVQGSNRLYFSASGREVPARVSDKFAFANSQVMDIYTGVFADLADYWQQPLGNGWWREHRLGERLVRHHLQIKQVSYQPVVLHSFILRHGAQIDPESSAARSRFSIVNRLIRSIKTRLLILSHDFRFLLTSFLAGNNSKAGK